MVQTLRRPFTISSTLTRPANTTAYTANQLVASSVTAGSVVVPSFNIAQLLSPQEEFLEITRARILTNLTTGGSALQFGVDLFAGTAPTFTNGDGGAYALATGAAALIGRLFSEVSSAQKASADGVNLDMCPGSAYLVGYGGVPISIGRNALLYWSLNAVAGFTPQSAETFTLSLSGYRHQ